jgi:hypothetical protein
MKSLVALLAAVGNALVVVASLVVATPANAEISQVNGHIWMASTPVEKRAYLVGVANTLAVNRELRIRRGTLDPNDPSVKMFEAMDVGTIDTAVGKIDNWYGEDPSRLDTPVLGVVWLGLVNAMNANQ